MVKSSYVFGAALALVGVSGLIESAEAATATVAAFTFETSAVPLNATNVTGPVYGPLLAESGVGSALGSHAATTTVFSSPGGNGSSRAFSSNVWAAGDYYQFTVPTTGFQDIIVSFDSGSSSTGPKVFTLSYSTGAGFSAAGNFTVFSTVTSTNTAGSATTNFGGTSNPLFTVSFDLSTITALNNAAGATFRLIDADTTTASGGTNRVDNFIVAGNAVAVPEPVSLALVAVGATGLVARRRRI